MIGAVRRREQVLPYPVWPLRMCRLSVHAFLLLACSKRFFTNNVKVRGALRQAVALGVHPYHGRLLDVYACLASACRVCARSGGAGPGALRRAALYGLLQAGAAEAMLAVGVPALCIKRSKRKHEK